MRRSRFFIDQPLAPGQTVLLEDDRRAHYLRNVLRLQSGTELEVFNGDGTSFTAVLETVQKQGVSMVVHEPIRQESAPLLQIELGLALIKRDPFDWAIQKATELGVTHITPLITSYTQAPGKGSDKKLDHWQGVVTSACEQCERNYLPAVSSPVQLKDWMVDSDATTYFAHPGKVTLNELPGTMPEPAQIRLCIGPEGGFDDSEVAQMENAGFQGLSLGPRILRADTAVVTLMALVQSKWGDLSVG